MDLLLCLLLAHLLDAMKASLTAVTPAFYCTEDAIVNSTSSSDSSSDATAVNAIASSVSSSSFPTSIMLLASNNSYGSNILMAHAFPVTSFCWCISVITSYNRCLSVSSAASFLCSLSFSAVPFSAVLLPPVPSAFDFTVSFFNTVVSFGSWSHTSFGSNFVCPESFLQTTNNVRSLSIKDCFSCHLVGTIYFFLFSLSVVDPSAMLPEIILFTNSTFACLVYTFLTEVVHY